MKTSGIFKSLSKAVFICFIIIAARSSASAQFLGTYMWDSTSFCVNVQGDAIAGWYGLAGTYVTGDTMDIIVDWGDGNTTPYLHNPLTVSGGMAYTNGISIGHTYTTMGTYIVSITSQDHYGYSQTIYDSIMVDNYCGFLYGNVLLDDGDAVFEWGSDLAATGVPIMVTTSLSNYGANTGTWGEYNITDIDQTATTYHIEIDPTWLTANGFSVVQPVAGSYDFTTPPMTWASYNFLLNCGGSYSDFAISGYGWGFQPGTSNGFTHILMSNFTCDGTLANVNLTITFDPMLTVTSCNIPGYSIVGNTITANLTGVSSWDNYTVFYSVPPGTPAFTPLVFDLNGVVTNYTDANPINNHYVINSEVRNSWDPNDKSTNVGPAIDANVTEDIYYNIRFQNMGNADAINIVIADTIDSQLDLSTFRIESQSHTGSYSLNPATRVVTFSFPNIMLPPEMINEPLSHGYIRYSIKENAGLPIGSEINNTAYIYFDTNPAIITNTTSNTNTSLGFENEGGISFSVYPQPTSEMFYISGINASDIKTISIMDGNGKMIVKSDGSKINDGIYVGNLAAGMYFVSIETTENTITHKLIVQH